MIFYGFIIKSIKRLFYQVLGIYLPASLLLLYFLLFWSDGDILNAVPYRLSLFGNSDYNLPLEIFLFLIGTIIIGEAINAGNTNGER